MPAKSPDNSNSSLVSSNSPASRAGSRSPARVVSKAGVAAGNASH